MKIIVNWETKSQPFEVPVKNGWITHEKDILRKESGKFNS
jgi:hypothetical protein